MTNKERKELAEWVVVYAKQCGASEVTTSISHSRSVELEVREKKIETIKESTEMGLSLNIYYNNRYSGHTTNNLYKDDLKSFISEAVEATKYLAADEFRKLPNPSLYPESLDRDLKIYDKNYDLVTPDERIRIAKEIEEIALGQSDNIISVSSGYADSISEVVRVHSNGFVGEKQSTSFWAGAEATVRDMDARPEGYFWGGSRYFSKLPSVEELGKAAVKSALDKVGQSKIASGKYDMLVENKNVPRLLSILFGAMTARALQQKSSFLDGQLNQQIASNKLSVKDNPFLLEGFGSRLYDGEGLASKERTVIENGVLKQFFIDNYYGAKLGMTPNSGSRSNVEFELGDKDQAEIIKGIQKGILVTGFNGGNSNSTTGDYSFGITGFFIENGILVKPINEMNISGNAMDLWQRLVEVGNDPYKYSSVYSPCMLFEGIDFSGM